MSEITLGDFVLDTEYGLLYRGGHEVAAEPKVLELLLYLYQHHDRYISLSELHQQVWADRVVSDSAIRSTIKKLRNLLDDNDLNQPRYIKSLPKRGYKLVCMVQNITAATPSLSAEQASSEIFITKPAAKFFSPERNSILRGAIWGMVLAGILITLYWLINWQSTTAETPLTISSQRITTPAVEKSRLAISPDGNTLAFAGRAYQGGGWQIYLMDRHSRNLRVLPVNTLRPSMLAFQNNHSLLVVDEKVGNSAIYQLSLDGESQYPQAYLNFFMILQISPGLKDGEWLINAIEHEQTTAMLFRWDQPSNTLQRIQARSSNVEHLYHSAYSADGRWLANAVFKGGRDYWLEIQDVQTMQTVYAEESAGRIDRLTWLNSDNLMILSSKQLSKLYLPTKQQELLTQTGEKFRDFVITDAGSRLYLLQDTPRAEPVFKEIALTPEFTAGSIINVAHGLRRLHYAEATAKYFAVLTEQQRHSLVSYDQRSGKIETLFSTEQRLELLDYHQQQNLLLLQVDEKLQVFDITRSVTHVIATPQTILDSHAAFSNDGQYIYFAEMIAGIWELYQFALSEQRSYLLAKGYRSVRETRDGFIAATENGYLYQLDHELRQLRPLGYKINTELISRWYVKEQRLIWSDFDFVSTSLNQLDLGNGKLQQFSLPFEQMWPSFAISHDGSRLLTYSLGERYTELLQMVLPTPDIN